MGLALKWAISPSVKEGEGIQMFLLLILSQKIECGCKPEPSHSCGLPVVCSPMLPSSDLDWTCDIYCTHIQTYIPAHTYWTAWKWRDGTLFASPPTHCSYGSGFSVQAIQAIQKIILLFYRPGSIMTMLYIEQTSRQGLGSVRRFMEAPSLKVFYSLRPGQKLNQQNNFFVGRLCAAWVQTTRALLSKGKEAKKVVSKFLYCRNQCSGRILMKWRLETIPLSFPALPSIWGRWTILAQEGAKKGKNDTTVQFKNLRVQTNSAPV